MNPLPWPAYPVVAYVKPSAAPDGYLAPFAEIIISAICRYSCIGNLNDPGHYPVHKVAIMAGHQQRPLNSLSSHSSSQMIDSTSRWLVGSSAAARPAECQNAGQGDTHFPTAAERFNG
jgi:hypothetical protein